MKEQSIKNLGFDINKALEINAQDSDNAGNYIGETYASSGLESNNI